MEKIRRNKERDREEQRKLAAMGWHCITGWECELTPKKRDETLESIAFTLNHIYLQDRRLSEQRIERIIRIEGDQREEEPMQIAAEEEE